MKSATAAPVLSLFMKKIIVEFNPFSTNVLLLYSLKTSENLRFSDVFRGYRNRTLVENRLKLPNIPKSFFEVTTSIMTLQIKFLDDIVS